MTGRIRSLKPEVLNDEGFAGLTDTAWRLVIGSFALADDYGNVRASAKYLAALIWQSTDATRVQAVEGALEELALRGLIQPYCSAWQRYYHIVGWDDPASPTSQRQDNCGKPRVPTHVHDDESDNGWLRDVRLRFAATRRDSPRFAARRGAAPLSRNPAAGRSLSSSSSPEREINRDRASARVRTEEVERAEVGGVPSLPPKPLVDPDLDEVGGAFSYTVSQATGVPFTLGYAKKTYLKEIAERHAPSTAHEDVVRWIETATRAYVESTEAPYRVGAFGRWIAGAGARALASSSTSSSTNGTKAWQHGEPVSATHETPATHHTMSAPSSEKDLEDDARAFFAMDDTTRKGSR